MWTKVSIRWINLPTGSLLANPFGQHPCRPFVERQREEKMSRAGLQFRARCPDGQLSSGRAEFRRAASGNLRDRPDNAVVPRVDIEAGSAAESRQRQAACFREFRGKA
jgi:hypothetical protein